MSRPEKGKQARGSESGHLYSGLVLAADIPLTSLVSVIHLLIRAIPLCPCRAGILMGGRAASSASLRATAT